MSKVIVRYKVKSELAVENRRLVQAVFTELNTKKPEGLRYAAFVGEDGTTFYHLALVEGESNPLLEIAAFSAFKENIAARYEESPGPIHVEEVGSFNFFD